ncbi:PBP1A family penicillin-binding protein [bacterium]|nr:PBP1A family penicillin-binding protein [bacterium]
MSIGLVGAGCILLWAAFLKVPDFKTFDERKVSESTKIYDRTGEIVLFDVHENIKRTVVSASSISPYVKNATIAIEDDGFYKHSGIKPTAILRALFANIGGMSLSQGGSTITQQVVKNSILTSEKLISRKIKEWILAIRLDREKTKEEILAFYLNEAPYGGSIYGIEEASRVYFGKDAGAVTLAEAAYLAALPQAPTRYSPYGKNKDLLEKRKNLVLKRMFELGYITQEEHNSATEEKVVFLPQSIDGVKAAHFVMYVRSYLEEKYGPQILDQGGVRVITTLDFSLQAQAEEIVRRHALENEKKFNAENAALVAIDPKTGQILAMVGSRDYFDAYIDGNFNVATAHRQPGSSFKPFVYATAFKKGLTPETVVFDVKTNFQTTCDAFGAPKEPGTNPGECYMPENYDHVFRGPVTLRNALAQSINVPAVKTLYITGVKDSIDTAVSMGITGLSNKNHYGLTLVLGGGEVSLLDMTSAYGVFANDGQRNPHTPILRVEDGEGNVIEEYKNNPREVLPKQIALQISDILSDNDARAPAFGEQSFLYFGGRDVAAKTGTTNDYRDAWVVGYTTSIAAGAWAGNNDNTPMEKKVAGFIVAPLWNEFMQKALVLYPEDRFENPGIDPDYKKQKPILRGIWQGGVTYEIDRISGKLATAYTPDDLRMERPVNNTHNILFWVDKNNISGPPPINPEKDPQFELWEVPVQIWLKNNTATASSSVISEIPLEYDDIHKPEFVPTINVTNPARGAEYAADKKISILLEINSHYPISRVEYFINDNPLGTTETPPYSLSFVPKDTQSIETQNILTIVVYDTVLNKNEEKIPFSIK